jgi:hypothetical protein
MFIDHGNGHTQFPTKSSWSDASASFVAQQWWVDYKQGDNISFFLQFLLSLDFMDHEHSSIPSFHKKEQLRYLQTILTIKPYKSYWLLFFNL